MPPKKKPEVSKKTEQKKKEKVIEDKTFGLKNKKGAKQQKFIKTVHTQVTQGGPKTSRVVGQEADKNKKKDEKKKLQEEINALFKPVTQTVAKGVDPKSVLCAFFKQGQCGKGDKCKFSHELGIERKQEKRSIYDDEKKDGIEHLDEAALAALIEKKHGESDKAKPKTALVCKHFLEAVENSKYGWFWECPNGAKCIYKHALPPGYVLKRDQRKEDKEEKISIEDLVETERAALGVDVTKVTLETFLKWKDRKKREKIANMTAENEKKKADYKAGRMMGISGRQMFEFNPDLIINDDDEAGEGAIEREVDEDEDDSKVVDITMDRVLAQASEVDDSGTQATTDRFQHAAGGMVNGKDSEEDKLGEAAALPPGGDGSPPSDTSKQEETDLAIAAAVSATINGDLEIDEDLFAEEDDDLIDELETLELEEENQL